MKRKGIRLLVFMLVCALALQIPAFAAFPDVAAGVWYEKYVNTLSELGVINGCSDGRFHADNPLRRGEFIKLIYGACELVLMDPEVRVHWAEPYWNTANDAGLFAGLNLPCTAASLDTEITRYEMAQIVYNALIGPLREAEAAVTEPGRVITDYASIPSGYAHAVEQVYAKGIITGYEDGSFGGKDTLNRGMAAAVVYRLLFGLERKPADFGNAGGGSDDPDPNYVPFAVYVQQNKLLNAYGKPGAELCRLLFGDPNKTYFANKEEAAPFMEDVTVSIWRINSSGAKYSTKATITVHKLVAEDVRRIFQEIYESPEQFPIKSVGGARFSDTMRHSWGCAIDINYNENCEGRWVDGILAPSCGEGWWPYVNPYSITPDGSVVAAFKHYGWGWGGQGFSSGKYDYMHFSIMPSGG